MSMEETIKEKTDKIVNRMKDKYMQNGFTFTEKDELIFRCGISNGILIAGLSLVETPSDITFEK